MSRLKKNRDFFFAIEIQIFWFTYLELELEAHIPPVSRPGGYYFHTKYELLTPTLSASTRKSVSGSVQPLCQNDIIPGQQSFKGNIWYLRTLGLHSSLQFLLDEHRVLDWNKIVAWNVFKIVGKHCATRKDPNFFRRRLAAPHCETIISIGMFIFTKSLICF